MTSTMELSGYSERVRRLRDRLEERLRERPWYLSWPILIAESLRRTEGLPSHRRRAEAFAHQLARAPVEIDRAEWIVGSHPGERQQDVDENALREARASVASQSARAQFWERHLRPEERAALDEGIVRNIGWRSGHVIVDHAKLLRVGFGGLRKEVEGAKATADEGGRDFLDSALVALDAGAQFIRRHADRARVAGMTEAAERCDWVAAHPPRTFAEALQLYWFTHLLVVLEEESWGCSYGRFDQNLIAFYQGDLAEGRLAPESALEWIECFWIKINECQVTGDSATLSSQNLTLGGVGADGAEAANPLTYLALDATEALQLRLPNISLRMRAAAPDPLWERAARLMQAGFGQPQVYNDEIMTRALAERIPMSMKIARSYAVQGCIETHIPGQCAPWMDCGINLPGCLLLALNGGRTLTTGRQVGPATPRIVEGATFDDLLGAYEAQVAHFAAMLSRVRCRFDMFQPTLEAVPFSSTLIADCLARGRDAYDGGARHKWGGVYCAGPATTADSLLVLKRLLDGQASEERSISGLLDALGSDFRCDPILREWAGRLPKYGNDHDEADLLTKRVSEFVCDVILRQQETDGGRLLPMLSSHIHNVVFGQVMPATPDGRSAGQPLSNVMSPSYGCDRLGPTAVIRSATKIDYTKAVGGSILNLKFTPAIFSGVEGRAKLASLLKTYLSLGGYQTQVNMLDQKVLLDAQADPRRHENLLVRVSGFCSKFVCLSREVQNEIIQRTPLH